MQSHLSSKEAYLEKFKVLQQDVADHGKELTTVEDMSAKLQTSVSDPAVPTTVAQLRASYDTLVSMTTDVVCLVERHYREQCVYEESYTYCVSWLHNAQDELDTWEKSVEPKLSALKELQKTMSEGHSRVKQAAKMCDTVTPHTSTDGAQTMRSNLEHFALSCDKLRNDVKKAIVSLRI
ncbi:PREDICTED: uncharacterized protein LOC106811054 [Priapulus caudatus]|uniref:Uncharacterized protein LOC106811054 n=1 Tax=Priapulus caudatus TaxID=37621 RepID=A0ABM1ECZ1_PRICU|nr:PREDICTED: uncharacterized protein LOC106811054 [Priapulus caudatus]